MTRKPGIVAPFVRPQGNLVTPTKPETTRRVDSAPPADEPALDDAPLDDAPLDDAPLDDAPLDDAPAAARGEGSFGAIHHAAPPPTTPANAPSEGSRNYYWKRMGRTWIAVSTVDRRRVATSITGQEEAAPVVRVRAADRDRARKPEVVREHVAHARIEEAAPGHTLSAAGRSGLAVDEILQQLVQERPSLAPLLATLAEAQGALRRLSSHEVERWLSLRNGTLRSLRLSHALDTGAGLAAVQEARRPGDTPEEERALDRAASLLRDDPLALYNLTAEAQRATWVEETGAAPGTLATLALAACAAGSGEAPAVGLPVPPAWAVSLLPLTATWRVARFLGAPDADSAATFALWAAAPDLWPSDLRRALAELAGRLDLPCPPPDDEAGWAQAALRLLAELLAAPPGELELAVQRPAEPAAYLRAAQHYLAHGEAHLAERAVQSALAAQSDHRRALGLLEETRSLSARGPALLLRVVDATGIGTIERDPGEDAPWSIRWLEAHDWPDDGAIDALPLPERVLGALRAAGYAAIGALRAASDLELLAIPGIGRDGYRRIRDVLGPTAAPPLPGHIC